jgi:drug/metabolite transporter (DMT)-like permease
MPHRAKVPLLLALNGLVIASHTILAKQAHGSGVAPIVYALASAAGAAVFLFAFRLMQGSRGITRSEVVYGLVAGLVSIALPQVLIYSASAFVSAGIASLAYAFPTPLTYLLAAFFGIERMTLGRTVGVGIAFAGATALAVTRSANLSGDGLWVLLAMLAPLFIAAGNIYRTRFWPQGSRPLDLAFAMSLAAAIWLTAAVSATGLQSFAGIEPQGFAYLAAAAVVAAFGNVIYFELQRAGGIVSFSQIGYVGAVLGLLGSTLLLGERFSAPTWVAAFVIGFGVLVSEALKPRGPAPSSSPAKRPS